MDTTIKTALQVLGLDVAEHPPKMKLVTKRFYELSFIHHPDRPGGDNIVYQQVTEAYRIIGDYVERYYEPNDDPDEEVARSIFQSFKSDDVKENLSSFTINIGNATSLVWDTVLTKHYGNPVDRTHNGKHWKHHGYTDESGHTGDITIGKWHIPKKDKQSKINIQSSQVGNFLPAHFVSVHLPKLLAEVKSATANSSLDYLPRIVSVDHCGTCNYKAKSRSQLKMHIRQTHNKTPVLKLPQVFEIIPPFNVLPATPTLPEPTKFNCFLCPDSYNEGGWDAHEKLAHSFKCNVCDETHVEESDLINHIKTQHESPNIKSSNPGPAEDISTMSPEQDHNLATTATQEVAADEAELSPIARCEQCNFTSSLNRIMKTHIQRNHEVSVSTTYNCDLCDFRATLSSALGDHVASTHMKNLKINLQMMQHFQCQICSFSTTNQSLLNNHVTDHHTVTPSKNISFQCELCPFTAPLHMNLKRHIAVSHAKIRCDKCTFTSSSGFHLALHQEHSHNVTAPQARPLCPCSLCGITFAQQDDLDSHIKRRHSPQDTPETPPHPPPTQPNPVLAMVLEEQIDMAQSLKELKQAIDAQLTEIRDGQEFLMQEMKKTLKDNVFLHSSFSKIETTQSTIESQVKNISNVVSSLPGLLASASSTAPAPAPATAPQTNSTSRPSSSTPSNPPQGSSSLEVPNISCSLSRPTSVHPHVHQAGMFSRPNLSSSANRSTTHPHDASPSGSSAPANSRLPTSLRSKVLFIADNIGSNVDVRHLEEATNTMIYMENAFGAGYKVDAFRPNENFTDACMNAPARRKYSHVVLQGSSTDITDLDTSDGGTSNLEFLKQEVVIASKNMVAAARNVVLNNPGIENVLILDRIPRFDLDTADPGHLKSKLSEYGNKIIREEIENCDVKAKISVASHILPRELHQNLYGHPDRRGYDGIHLNGPDGRNYYTRSVCNILQRFLPRNSRDPHNHTIPRMTSIAPTISASGSSGSSSRPPPAWKSKTPSNAAASTSSSKTKPDSVIIDIDSSDHEENQYLYSVPTYNQFSALGNCLDMTIAQTLSKHS